jgi:hypothetical protein
MEPPIESNGGCFLKFRGPLHDCTVAAPELEGPRPAASYSEPNAGAFLEDSPTGQEASLDDHTPTSMLGC